jgi:polyisoprenoid-binding protein YceI
MKKSILSAALFIATLGASAQVLTSELAFVSFYSELEDVTANNYSGVSDLDTTTGRILFSFAIQSFMFENATMQQHFNEVSTMNSKAFPRAKFVGRISDHEKINYSKNGDYKVKVTGSLTMKGTTRPIETTALINIANGTISASATFTLDRFEFGVTGKEGSISQQLELNVKVIYA